jgi:hypothetical protein
MNFTRGFTDQILDAFRRSQRIGNIDELLAVEGIDVFFIGPGDLSQNMGYPPAPPFGQPRPQAVIDKVGFTVDKIRAAGNSRYAGDRRRVTVLARKRREILLCPFRPLPAPRTERYQEVARAVSFRVRSQHEVTKWHLNCSH